MQVRTFADQLARKLMDGGTLLDVQRMITDQLAQEDAEQAMERAIRDEMQNEAFNVLQPIAAQVEEDERLRKIAFWESWEKEREAKKAASV